MFLLNLLLALSWVVLTGQYTPESFIFGLALGYGLLWLGQRFTGRRTYFSRVPLAVRFVLYFAWELLVANLRVAVGVLRPHSRLRPAVVAIPLDAETDAEIVLFTTLMTLTPGTLALDVTTDRSELYIHAMDVGPDIDAFRQEIKDGFERRVLELLR